MISSAYEPGTRCWVPDDKTGWVGAEVISKDLDGEKVTLQLKLENGAESTVETTTEALEKNADSLPPLRNPPVLETTEDLTSLSYLNEPAVLNAIKMRYAQLNIYTYSGIVLIATNPFQRVDNLYTPDIIQAYAGKRRGELEPHLFAIAEDAYRCMLRDNKNQTIVVSGESGAGKTVSAKYIMRYFATVEDPDRPRKGSDHLTSSGPAHDALSETEEQILATNPIMEAFGNARTTRNDNSSRFGKYLEILFDKDVEIVGARIRTYLLERSRLVFQPLTERNYHIFYQLCSGASEAQREEFGLLPIEEFNYLNQGGDYHIANIDDAEEFSATKQALETIGINEAMQHDIFKVLAALLYIGNIKITATRTNAILPSDEPALVQATKLLGLDATNFAKWIVKKQITTRNEKITSNLSEKQSLVVRDSVSKYIYSLLFDWLVYVINNSLCPDSIKDNIKSFIGVLDIYGFEHFKKNSFEQFCINYANEKLQQEFNQHVFKLEQDEYIKEEIEWTFIEFSDNQPCISLIEAKLGILSLLDEESRLPAGNDDGFVNKLYQNFDKKESFFKKPRFGNSAFIVKHYAMEVSYESEGFIEKNRDTVPDELVEVLENTENEFLKTVLTFSKVEATPPPATKTTGRTTIVRKPTLGSIFKGSLIELMSTINSTNAHYIRCIKPNDEKAAWKFNGPMVLSQLRACGVLETIRISCAGFPTRWTYEEFASRYYMLVPSSEWSQDVQPLCDSILKKSIPEDGGKYQLGKTKIFFRAGMLAYLEKLRSDRLTECAIVIQKNLRMVYYRRKYQKTRSSIISAQAVIRGFLSRMAYQKERSTKAAVVIQKRWRGYRDLNNYKKTRASVVDLQRVIRGHLLRQSLLNQRYNSAATTIQKHWRSYSARKNYKDTRKKIIIVQGLVRRRQAIKELKVLRVEAKSVNHYKEVQYRLENKVVELTQNLSTKREENRKLQGVIDGLQSQINQWQKKHADVLEQMDDLKVDHEESLNKSVTELTTIQSSLAALQKEHSDAVAQLQELNTNHSTLKDELATKHASLEAAEQSIKQYLDNETNLTETINQLKQELDNAVKMQGSAGSMAPSLSPLRNLGGGAVASTTATKKRAKRHSLTSGSFANQVREAVGYSPRPASIAIPNTSAADSSMGHRRQFSSSTEISVNSLGLNGDIERILEDEKILYAEVIQGLIFNLKMPIPSSSEKTTVKEVLFPANIINLITSEMWRLGFVKESEKFLGEVMNAIQDLISHLSGESIINSGAFWISNVHDMYSFICLAEANIVRNEALHDEMGDFEFHQYGQLVTIVKKDLENLEFNIYHMWMKEIKKQLDKMVVSAVVMSQSLPGFFEHENTRFLSKVFNSASNTATMDDLISLFNKVYKALEAYYLEPEFIKQPILELLRLVGVKSFNDLLMRRSFLTWKRGLQINYNITRIEEWCKAHNVSEGILRLEHIMQSVKLLQLKKSTFEDIEIIYDICWTLSPAQIQKLVQQYSVADYEQPISPEILAEVASRVKNDNSGTLLLEAIPLDDSGPFEIVEPRPLKRIESYIPGWIQVPNLKRLAELTAAVNNSSNQGSHGEMIDDEDVIGGEPVEKTLEDEDDGLDESSQATTIPV